MHSTLSQEIPSLHNELFQGALVGTLTNGGAVSLSFLIRHGLKNITALFTSLLLELAEMEFWPAFV
jgi:hypothetical protein